MKTFQLNAEARVDLGKKAAKALRSEGKIPVVLNGGEVVELPYAGTLQKGEKLVEIGNLIFCGSETSPMYLTASEWIYSCVLPGKP